MPIPRLSIGKLRYPRGIPRPSTASKADWIGAPLLVVFPIKLADRIVLPAEGNSRMVIVAASVVAASTPRLYLTMGVGT